MERRHDVDNTAEDQRRSQRSELAQKVCAGRGLPLATLVAQARRASQRCVKFIRWLRQTMLARMNTDARRASRRSRWVSE